MEALWLAGLTLLSARGAGRRILAQAGGRAWPRGERELLSLGLGLGVAAYLVLLIGLLGWLHPVVLAAVVAVGLALNLPGALPDRETIDWGLRRLQKWLAARALLDWVLLAAISSQAGLNLVAALAPPTGVDPLVYHLAVPRLYVLAGSIDFVPGNYYASQPAVFQMLYTLLLALGSGAAAQVLHWATGLICVGAIVVLAEAWRPPAVGLAAGALFYAVTDVGVQSSLALVDLGGTAFFLLAAVALARWLSEPRPGGLIVAGLLGGAYAATRLTNPIGVVALAVGVVAAAWWKGRGLAKSVKAALVFGGVAFATVLPWYVKSWALTGNPVFPFLYGWFGGRGLLPAQADAIFQAQYFDVDVGYSLVSLVLAPLTLTLDPERLHSGQLGPLFLGLVPLALFLKHPTRGRWFLLTVAVFFPLWFWSYPRLRTLLPALALLALPVALAWWTLVAHRSRWVRAVGLCALFGWLLVSLFANARYHGSALAAGLGLEPGEAYLARVLPAPPNNFPWYEDFRLLSQDLPGDAKVMIWDTRGYYLARPAVWARALAQSLPVETQRDPSALVRQARALGVTHVALPRAPLADAELERLRTTMLQSTELQVAVETPQLIAYRLPGVAD